MIRFGVTVSVLLSFVSFGQITSSASASASPVGTIGDTTEFDSLWVQPDFLPIPKNGGWVWFDIANDQADDAIHITDFVIPASGFHHDFVLKNDSMWGILNGDGYEIAPFIYDSIIYIDQQLITLSDGSWSYHYQTFSEFDGDSGEMFDSLVPISFDSLFFDGMEIYLFDEGKTGMIFKSGEVIPPSYDGIHRFSCAANFGGDRYYVTLSGEEYNLLDPTGDELLPDGVWDVRCTEDGVIEFRRDQDPEFYIPYMDEFLRPNGRDVIFYKGHGYKIYNEDNTRGEFHLVDGRVLKGDYEDYFHLTDDFYAVRLNGKVGLTKNGRELLSELKYDQINAIYPAVFADGVSNYYFKYFVEDACGLMDQFGREVFDANYANIIFTSNSDRFIVLDKSLTGVVDRTGKTIIPIKYHHIFLDESSQLFVIQHEKKLGLFRLNGTQMLPIEYDLYRSLQSFGSGDSTNGLFVLKKGGKFYFATRNGFIYSNGFNHYDHTTDILKTYDSRVISVFIFDSLGQVEEKQEYPIYENTIIKRDYWDLDYVFKSWNASELEENQTAGYYGLRFYAKRGMGVQPKYRTIRPTGFSDFIGAVDVEPFEYAWTDEKSTQVIGGFDHLKTGSGSIDNATFFSSDIQNVLNGSGDRFINTELDGTQVRSYWHHPSTNTISISDRILYTDNANSDNIYRRYFMGGSVEICPIELAELSLYDYFNYWNALDACRVSPEVMREILNPKLGVRFVNSETAIINGSWMGVGPKIRSFETASYFDAFKLINWSVYFERSLNVKNGNLQSNILPEKDKKSVVITDVIEAREAEAYISNFVLAKVKNDQISKIHIDYPDYFFHQDSVDLSYEAGRITRRLDSNYVRLITPTGAVVADSCVLVRYLNEDRFAVFRLNGWELIDKDGRAISETKFTSVSEFNNNRAEFGLPGGSAVLINSLGEEMLPLPEPRKFIDDDYYYFASNPAVIANKFSQVQDQAGVGEKYESNGFFVSKSDGITRIRRFGTARSIEVKLTSKLKSFGSCLYYSNGKHFYSIDSTLVITKHKKVDKFREVTPEIGWLDGKKEQLINSDWETICAMTKNERFEMKDGRLIVFENDSVFKDFGTLKPTDVTSTGDETPQVKVFSENGKYGVQRGEEVLLPATYAWLSKINEQEFLSKTSTENQLFDSKLKRVGKQPFDRYIQTMSMNFVFFYNNQTYLISRDGDFIKMIQ